MHAPHPCINTLSLVPAAPVLAQRLRDALRAWWTALWADERTRYLALASDLPDLERRIRCWENADRSAWLTPM